MTGLLKRLTRWRSVRDNASGVLGINERNLQYIYTHNRRRDFQLADNKLRTKELLERINVERPETYRVYSHFFELGGLGAELSRRDDFVIKPARGHGGGGIVVVAGRHGPDFVGVDGAIYTLDDLRRHISDIIFGVFSFDLHDQAIVEARIEQHPRMAELSPSGLADVRIILCRHEPIISMTRIPTQKSGGRANLHQGAVGVGIDLGSGRTLHAIDKSGEITAHPDTGAELIGFSIPHWETVLGVSRKVAEAVPLKYLGIDIALTPEGVVVIEINVRPGLQIQNANMSGMREILERDLIVETDYL